MLKAEVYVKLKESVIDPQGLTVKHALESMGYHGLKGVRIGKVISLELNHQNKKRAAEQIDQMCGKLLANPIIEDYSFKIREG